MGGIHIMYYRSGLGSSFPPEMGERNLKESCEGCIISVGAIICISNSPKVDLSSER